MELPFGNIKFEETGAIAETESFLKLNNAYEDTGLQFDQYGNPIYLSEIDHAMNSASENFCSK